MNISGSKLFSLFILGFWCVCYPCAGHRTIREVAVTGVETSVSEFVAVADTTDVNVAKETPNRFCYYLYGQNCYMALYFGDLGIAMSICMGTMAVQCPWLIKSLNIEGGSMYRLPSGVTLLFVSDDLRSANYYGLPFERITKERYDGLIAADPIATATLIGMQYLVSQGITQEMYTMGVNGGYDYGTGQSYGSYYNSIEDRRRTCPGCCYSTSHCNGARGRAAIRGSGRCPYCTNSTYYDDYHRGRRHHTPVCRFCYGTRVCQRCNGSGYVYD